MFKVINNTVYNNNKKIKTFDNEEDAQDFKSAISIMYNENKLLEEKNKVVHFCTTINEFKKMNNFN